MERLSINTVLLWKENCGIVPMEVFVPRGDVKFQDLELRTVTNLRSLWIMGMLDYQKQIMYRMPISFYYTQSMLAHINTCSGN